MFDVSPDRADAFLPNEWSAVRDAGVSLLISGPGEVTRSLVAALQPQFRQPVVVFESSNAVALPADDQVRTLVLHDISQLAPVDQERLLTWLDGATTRVQIISTTARPILPLIESGAFLAPLYYRLNTVCVDVTTSE
jgi:hypothetical protein